MAGQVAQEDWAPAKVVDEAYQLHPVRPAVCPDGFRTLYEVLHIGKVEVRIDWTRERDLARVTVADDGVGLPETGVERLFEPSFSTKTRGTGLGLAITRRIVEAWGGTIDWERLPEGGTAIHVRLRTAGQM